ncbi:hypothetical protein [Luteipulveratus flavus]|uniref:Uncharacterized protein n=1 Tax=Luteipulveratus flavus TaxID=3031728 RepID=A0ABT6C9V3_9MICO|nr:hypothetical protein [Luteipulveratus sp. YIM 133296]MDF8265681.1 hypothetical protein [Luteipulveratus sp. YIM 133296]
MAMPDWTYGPLRAPAGALVGVRRSQRWALGLLAAVCSVPGGRLLARTMAGTEEYPEQRGSLLGHDLVGPVGVSAGAEVGRPVLRAMPEIGAAVVEIGPLSPQEARELRREIAASAAPVLLRCTPGRSAEVRDAVGSPPTVAGYVEGDRLIDTALQQRGVVVRTDDPDDVAQHRAGHEVVVAVTDSGDAEVGRALAAAGADAVLLHSRALVDGGPGLPNHLVRSLLPAPVAEPAPTAREVLRTAPWSWPMWAWGVGLGVGMLAGGVGAAAVAVGPGLLWYDEDHLGMTREQLDGLVPRFVPFLQHDRITLAGTMVCLGILYVALSYCGLRQGIRAAERALWWSAVLGFPTLLYFLGTGYFEPLHAGLAAVLTPMFLLATRSREPRRWSEPRRPPPEVARRGLTGQLLVVSMSVGLIVAGLFISVTGLTYVYVPTDLVYIGHDAFHLHALNPALQGFAAHDRAGFGGALLSAGVGLSLLSICCWAPGRRWVWWAVTLSMLAGFVPTLIVHVAVGYVDPGHLLPAYVGFVVTAVGSVLARRHLYDDARLG